jgi:hypothetical protein
MLDKLIAEGLVMDELCDGVGSQRDAELLVASFELLFNLLDVLHIHILGDREAHEKGSGPGMLAIPRSKHMEKVAQPNIAVDVGGA